MSSVTLQQRLSSALQRSGHDLKKGVHFVIQIVNAQAWGGFAFSWTPSTINTDATAFVREQESLNVVLYLVPLLLWVLRTRKKTGNGKILQVRIQRALPFWSGPVVS